MSTQLHRPLPLRASTLTSARPLESSSVRGLPSMNSSPPAAASAASSPVPTAPMTISRYSPPSAASLPPPPLSTAASPLLPRSAASPRAASMGLASSAGADVPALRLDGAGDAAATDEPASDAAVWARGARRNAFHGASSGCGGAAEPPCVAGQLESAGRRAAATAAAKAPPPPGAKVEATRDAPIGCALALDSESEEEGEAATTGGASAGQPPRVGVGSPLARGAGHASSAAPRGAPG